MKKTYSMDSIRLLTGVVLICLIVDLLILISGIDSVKPLPGKPLPNPFADLADLGPTENQPQAAWGGNTLKIMIQALFAFGIALILVFVIFSKQHRKHFAIILLVLLALFLILAYIGEIPKSDQSAILETNMATEFGPAPPVEQVQVNIPKVKPSGWQVIVIALASSLLIALFVIFFLAKVYPFIRSRFTDQESVLNQLGKSAGVAANRIVSGDDPRAAILRCYQEMTQIMSKHEQVPNYSYLTPREFALRLRRRGMKDDDVDRLTAIFEAVRYGGRSGAEFVSEALSCLRSIHRTHATKEPV